MSEFIRNGKYGSLTSEKVFNLNIKTHNFMFVGENWLIKISSPQIIFSCN